MHSTPLLLLILGMKSKSQHLSPIIVQSFIYNFKNAIPAEYVFTFNVMLKMDIFCLIKKTITKPYFELDYWRDSRILYNTALFCLLIKSFLLRKKVL